MSVAIIGTILLETVNNGPVCLGGNAYLAALASAVFAPSQLVGAVGQDIDKNLLVSKNIDLSNVAIVLGKTFKHSVQYSAHGEVTSHRTDFGDSYTAPINSNLHARPFIKHFSGGNPKMALEFLTACKGKSYVSVDLNEYHLQHNLIGSMELARKADIIFLNQREKEILQQYKFDDLEKAFPSSSYIVLKRGKSGIQILHRSKVQTYQNRQYVATPNPANAGDVLAGSLLGQMAQSKKFDPNNKLFVKKAFKQVELVMSGDAYYRKELI